MHEETSEMIKSQLTSLDRYLVLKNASQNTVHNIEKNSMQTQKNLLALERIRDVIGLAEDKIKSITEDTFVNAESKCVHLNEPSYFDEDFDQKSYIQQLVKAKLYGMTIIQDVDTTNMLRKNKIMLKTMVNMKKRTTLPSTVRRLSSDAPESNSKEIEASVPTHRSVKNIQLIEVNAAFEEPKQIYKSSKLSVQNLPSISIRSQLMEQKFPSVDIYPGDENNSIPGKNDNIVVVESKHEDSDVKETPVDDAIDDSCEVESNTSHKDADRSSILQSKKVKFVKLVNDSVFKKADLPLANAEHDLRTNVNIGLGQINNQSDSYIFLNKHNINLPVTDSPYRSLRKKNISTLKKFGLPEIQKIYNPKKTIYIQRGSNLQYSSPYIITNKSQKQHLTRQYMSKSTYSSSKPLDVTSSNKSHINVEYIPYSKFTIGGIKVDNAQKTSNHSSTIDDPKPVNFKKAFNDIDESRDFEDAMNSTISTEYERPNVSNSDSDHESIEIKETSSNRSKANSEHNKATQTSSKYIGDICKDIKNVHGDSTQNENLETVDINSATVEDKLQPEFTSIPSTSKLSNENGSARVREDKKGKVLTFPKNTQTPEPKTVNVMTSPPKMINRKLSPAFADTKKSTFTSPVIFSGDDQIPNEETKVNESVLFSSNDSKLDTVDSGAKSKYAYKKRQSKIDISSDDYVEGSLSESSDLQSLGEINLRILKKRLVKILDETNSVYSNSSITTSINSDIQLNSTFSSKKSDGEVNKKRK